MSNFTYTENTTATFGTGTLTNVTATNNSLQLTATSSADINGTLQGTLSGGGVNVSSGEYGFAFSVGSNPISIKGLMGQAGYTCHLWTIGGSLLGSVTIPTGQSSANFGSPITLSASTMYVVSMNLSGGSHVSSWTTAPTTKSTASSYVTYSSWKYTSTSGNFPSTTTTNYWGAAVDIIIAGSTSYPTSGSRTSQSISITGVTNFKGSTITWTATTPTNTTVGIQTSVDNGATWQTPTGGSSIPNLTSTSQTILLKENLSTTDTTKTPSLTNVTITVLDSVSSITHVEQTTADFSVGTLTNVTATQNALTLTADTTQAFNLAGGKSYTKSLQPSGSYPDTNNVEFTDGLVSATSFTDGQSFGYPVATWGTGPITGYLDIVVDLQNPAWAYQFKLTSGGANTNYAADTVQIYTSLDNTNWTSQGTVGTLGTPVANQTLTISNPGVFTRYVKFHIGKNLTAAGQANDWMFIDEGQVLVYRNQTTGNRVHSINISSMSNISTGGSKITWTSTVPTGSSLAVQTSVDNVNWSTVTNGGTIPNLTNSTTTLYVKEIFTGDSSSIHLSPYLSRLEIDLSSTTTLVITSNGSYSIHTTKTQNGNGSYSVKVPLSKNSNGSYAIKAPLNKTANGSYAIKNSLSKNSNFSYAIKRTLNQNSNGSYAVKALLNVPLTSGSYTIKNPLNRTTNGDYSVFTAKSLTNNGSYAVKSTSNVNTNGSYAIKGDLNKNTSVDYSVKNNLTKNSNFDYAIKTQLDKNTNGSYSIKNILAAITLNSNYAVKNLINKSTNGDYAIKLPQSINSNGNYAIKTNLVDIVNGDYSVSSTLNVVSANIIVDYAVKADLTKTINSNYAIKSTLVKQIMAGYAVKNNLSTNANVDYAIKQTLALNSNADYAVKAMLVIATNAFYDVVKLSSSAESYLMTPRLLSAILPKQQQQENAVLPSDKNIDSKLFVPKQINGIVTTDKQINATVTSNKTIEKEF